VKDTEYELAAASKLAAERQKAVDDAKAFAERKKRENAEADGAHRRNRAIGGLSGASRGFARTVQHARAHRYARRARRARTGGTARSPIAAPRPHVVGGTLVLKRRARSARAAAYAAALAKGKK
jgi:hypothetical protein